MRTSPSIAPHGPEQDTYIVLTILALTVGHGVRPMKREPIARRFSETCLTRNMKIRSASSPSIPPRAGPVTSLWTSPMSYAADLLNTTRCQRRFSPSWKRRPKSTETCSQSAIALGWLWKHLSGTYVKFTPAGAELFA